MLAPFGWKNLVPCGIYQVRPCHCGYPGRFDTSVVRHWGLFVPLSQELVTSAIERWAGTLEAWLRTRCDNPEDIVQETFCRLATQSQQPQRMAAWLFQVAVNLCNEQARSQRRRIRREQIRAVHESLPCANQSQMDRSDVRQAVQQLPAELRDVVIARLWGDLTLQETAQLLKLSTSTVHRRYADSLARLRVLLVEYASEANSENHEQ